MMWLAVITVGLAFAFVLWDLGQIFLKGASDQKIAARLEALEDERLGQRLTDVEAEQRLFRNRLESVRPMGPRKWGA